MNRRTFIKSLMSGLAGMFTLGAVKANAKFVNVTEVVNEPTTPQAGFSEPDARFSPYSTRARYPTRAQFDEKYLNDLVDVLNENNDILENERGAQSPRGD